MLWKMVSCNFHKYLTLFKYVFMCFFVKSKRDDYITSNKLIRIAKIEFSRQIKARYTTTQYLQEKVHRRQLWVILIPNTKRTKTVIELKTYQSKYWSKLFHT